MTVTPAARPAARRRFAPARLLAAALLLVGLAPAGAAAAASTQETPRASDTVTPSPTVAQPATAVTAGLSGRVTFADGRPARESKVELVPSGREDAWSWAFSDLRGRWALAATVPAGGYHLRFVLSDGDWFWYPGTKDRDEADVVTVAGDATDGLDVIWPPPARVRITVKDVDGTPLSGVCLDRTRVARCTKSHGVVTLPDVDAGPVVVSGWSRSGRWYLPATTLLATRGHTLETSIVAQPTATVRGVLLDSDGTPIPGACPEAFTLDDPTTPLAHARPRCSDVTGGWQISGLPATGVRVRLLRSTDTGPATQWWPMSASFDGGQVIATFAGTVADAGTARTPPLGSLVGKVIDVDGNLVAGAWVQWGTADEISATGSGSERSATTDSDGHFRIDGVPAWTAPMLVTAPGSTYGATWSGGASRASSAEAVTVAWGRTTRVTLTLLPQAPLLVTLDGALVAGDGYRVDAVDEYGNVMGTGTLLGSDRPTGLIRGLAAGPVRLRLTHIPAGPSGSVWDGPLFYPAAGDASAATALTLPGNGTCVVWTVPARG